MKRKKSSGSVMGDPQRTSYDYMKFLKNKYGSADVLVVDDVDGLHGIPFTRKGHKTTIYESDSRYITGGIIDTFNVLGLKKRLQYEELKNITINNSNYEQAIEKKYEFIYCYRSLHRESNKHISMMKKLRKLLSSVKENGYIYIFYHIAKNENDVRNFSRDRYFRKGEMVTFFDKSNWEIISIKEFDVLTNHKLHPHRKSEHTHKVGHIFAQRKNNRLVYKYNFNIIAS